MKGSAELPNGSVGPEVRPLPAAPTPLQVARRHRRSAGLGRYQARLGPGRRLIEAWDRRRDRRGRRSPRSRGADRANERRSNGAVALWRRPRAQPATVKRGKERRRVSGGECCPGGGWGAGAQVILAALADVRPDRVCVPVIRSVLTDRIAFDQAIDDLRPAGKIETVS